VWWYTPVIPELGRLRQDEKERERERQRERERERETLPHVT
jgi:hypothetical protein